jgi:hypothetical protein
MDTELARSFEQFKHNLNWFREHATELDIFNRYPGRHIAVAADELFVGDSPEEAVRLALEKHPGNHPFIQHIQKQKPFPQANGPLTFIERPMPPELGRMFEQSKRNADWFDEHAMELDVFNRYRGKYIAVAGGELFVGDSASEAFRLAKEKYPDDSPHRRYIPKTKARHIHAHQRHMEDM